MSEIEIKTVFTVKEMPLNQINKLRKGVSFIKFIIIRGLMCSD